MMNDDDMILRLIGDYYESVDPVPPELTLGARAALAMRDFEAELAELTFDSAQTTVETLGVRTTAAVRMLSFGIGDRSVELEVTDADDGVVLTGQIDPATAATVTVQQPGHAVAVAADTLGTFRVEGLSTGPLSLRVEFEGLPPLRTSWVVV